MWLQASFRSLGNIEAEKEILPAAGETSAYRRPKPGTAIISGPGGNGLGLRAVRAGEGGGAPAQRWAPLVGGRRGGDRVPGLLEGGNTLRGCQ